MTNPLAAASVIPGHQLGLCLVFAALGFIAAHRLRRRIRRDQNALPAIDRKGEKTKQEHTRLRRLALSHADIIYAIECVPPPYRSAFRNNFLGAQVDWSGVLSSYVESEKHCMISVQLGNDVLMVCQAARGDCAGIADLPSGASVRAIGTLTSVGEKKVFLSQTKISHANRRE